MQVVWYTPFPDGSFVGDMSTFTKAASQNAAASASKKSYRVIQYKPGKKGQLKALGRKVRLYVIGHGDFSNKYIIGDIETSYSSPGFSLHNKKLALTPEQLADILMYDGIDRYVSEIRLWACIGARGTNSFAERFGETARWRWPSITVYGYTDYLLLTRSGKMRGAVLKELDSRPASKSLVNITKKLRAEPDPQPTEADLPEDPFANGSFGSNPAWRAPK